MPILITGAGQIARALVGELSARSERAVVIRRSPQAVANTRTVQGDAGDHDAVLRAARGCSAIVHCIHAAYDPDSWRRTLPQPEHTVMDVAAELGIPVAFPESVYAWGHRAEDLVEGAEVNPCSPLGEVRAQLLAARARHGAHTVSVVAGDLVGPTTTAQGSIPRATVIDPVRRGRTAWLLGDPTTRHQMTEAAGLARALLAALDLTGMHGQSEAVLHCPSPPAISLNDLAELTRMRLGRAAVTTRHVPSWSLAAAGIVSPTWRSMHEQLYLWQNPVVLRPGRLEHGAGLKPTPWSDIALV